MNHVCQPMSAVSVHRPLRKAIVMDLDGTVAISVRQVPLGQNNAISSDFQKAFSVLSLFSLMLSEKLNFNRSSLEFKKNLI
jgi:hypothetical protein